MGATAVKALDATTSQLDALYRRHGVDWSDAALSNHLGVTPMLGNNDVAGERFDTADARQVLDYVRSHGLQRVSYWSLNRDTACGPNNPGRLSNVCSGVAEKPQEFAGIFGVLHGTAAAAAGVRATPHVASVPADNPNTAPYPIWQTARVYVKGDKVVWRGSVYQAKWYSQGDVPDAPVQHDWNTPWRLVGPVLPTDRPVPTTTLPAGTYPDWSSGVAYQKGARVLYRGVGYEAKWYTVGDAPDPSPVDPYSAPWSRIGSG
jgi:chitinase